MPDMQRFADIVHVRRRALGLSLAAIASAGGPSEPTMVRIESGSSSPLRSATFSKLDNVLRWADGSARSAYDGGDPAALESADSQPTPAGELLIAYGTLVELIEIGASLRACLESEVVDRGDVVKVFDRYRLTLSPLVGKVASALLRNAGDADHINPARVATALEDFWAASPQDVTPARTNANTERRNMARDAIERSNHE